MPLPPTKQPHRPRSGVELWTYLVLIFGVTTCFAIALFQDFEPSRMSAVFFVIFWCILLVLHEAGHAVAALALGWRVLHVVIGAGPTVKRFRIRGVPIELRAFPVEGFVLPVPRRLVRPRLESVIVYAAGAAAELVVLVVIIAALGWERLLTRADDIGTIALQTLALVIVVSVMINLVPHTTRSSASGTSEADAIDTPNDGLGILLSLTRPREHFVALCEEGRKSDRDDSRDEV